MNGDDCVAIVAVAVVVTDDVHAVTDEVVNDASDDAYKYYFVVRLNVVASGMWVDDGS